MERRPSRRFHAVHGLNAQPQTDRGEVVGSIRRVFAKLKKATKLNGRTHYVFGKTLHGIPSDDLYLRCFCNYILSLESHLYVFFATDMTSTRTLSGGRAVRVQHGTAN